MDLNYLEYDVTATVNIQDECITLISEGCTDSTYLEFSATANVSNPAQCINAIVSGCSDALYVEFDPVVNSDDGSCLTLIIRGCTDSLFVEFNADANTDNGSCATLVVEGCTDNLYTEYNADANTDDGSCLTLAVLGCTDSLYLEFDASANTDDGSCATEIVLGCTDSLACNYNASANLDDASCFSLSAEIVIEFLGNSLNTIVSPEDSVATYAWYLNDTIITGETASSLIPTQNGTYVLEVTIGGCTVSDSFVVESLNITDLELVNVNVYPNPARDVLNISLDNSVNLVDVQVVNTLGAVVLSRTLQSNGNGSFQLEVSDLELGVYILKTISNGSTISTPWLKK